MPEEVFRSTWVFREKSALKQFYIIKFQFLKVVEEKGKSKRVGAYSTM